MKYLESRRAIICAAITAAVCVGGVSVSQSQVTLRLEVPQTAVLQYEPAFINVFVTNVAEDQVVAPDGLLLKIQKRLSGNAWMDVELNRKMSGMTLDRGTGALVLKAKSEVCAELQISHLGMISSPGQYRVRVMCRVFRGMTDLVGNFNSEWANVTVREHAGNASVLNPASREGSMVWKSYLRVLMLQDPTVSPDSVAIPFFLEPLSIEPLANEMLRHDFSPLLRAKAYLGLAALQVGLGNYHEKNNEGPHGYYNAALAYLDKCPEVSAVPRTGGLAAQITGLKAACFAKLGNVDTARSMMTELEKYEGFLSGRRRLRELLECTLK